MSAFEEDEVAQKFSASSEEEGNGEVKSSGGMIDYASPRDIIYCPTCTMPTEFCEHGACFDKCLPWIFKNCPQVLSDAVLAEMMGETSLDDDVEGGEKKKEKKKGGGAAALKKTAVVETKVIITRVQRQKKKFWTVVAGLETVADLKIKDASKIFGKKFASGCSVAESQGHKEVVIQGDVLFDLPAVLIGECKVSPSAIFILEDGVTRPYR